MLPRPPLWCRAVVPRAAAFPRRFLRADTLSLGYYKRAITSTVVVSRSATVVEASHRRIVVEYSRSTVVGRSTVVVGKSCSYSIFDVVVILCGLSSIIEEVDLFDRRISGVI